MWIIKPNNPSLFSKYVFGSILFFHQISQCVNQVKNFNFLINLGPLLDRKIFNLEFKFCRCSGDFWQDRKDWFGCSISVFRNPRWIMLGVCYLLNSEVNIKQDTVTLGFRCAIQNSDFLYMIYGVYCQSDQLVGFWKRIYKIVVSAQDTLRITRGYAQQKDCNKEESAPKYAFRWTSLACVGLIQMSGSHSFRFYLSCRFFDFSGIYYYKMEKPAP